MISKGMIISDQLNFDLVVSFDSWDPQYLLSYEVILKSVIFLVNRFYLMSFYKETFLTGKTILETLTTLS